MKYVLIVCSLFLMLTVSAAFAQSEGAVDTAQTGTEVQSGDAPVIDIPAPPTNVVAKDNPSDDGHGIVVTWTPSVDYVENPNGKRTVMYHEVYRWEPYMLDSLTRARGQYQLVHAGRSPLIVDQDSVQVAQVQVADSGIVDVARLSFVPVLPAEFETADSLTRAQMLTQALADTLKAITGPYTSTKDSVRYYRKRFYEVLDRLPAAYDAYPANGNWRELGVGIDQFLHKGAKDRMASSFFPDHCDYYYRVDAVTSVDSIRASSAIAGPVQSSGQWYRTSWTIVLIFVIGFTVLLMAFVRLARRGSDLYVRPLGGIEAVDEAIGRATEMGRPILYVLGLGSAADVATIASFSILGRVAKRVAEYQTPLLVPTYDPIVMTVAQEVVKSSYMDAGRPDDYHDEIVFFVTQSQFAYVAAVNGIMLRHLPATNVYMGKFYAESLILAETGALAGSIQIAGTDEIAQIPFFIVACDYTLIGEELYAASAYLSREPVLLGSLKAQDYLKAAVIVFAILGLVAAQFEWTWFTSFFVVGE